MTYPVRPLVKPADLAGQKNGELDPTLLRDVGPRAGWKMHHIAARCWEAMRAAAARDGLVLSYSGNPYRDLAGQVSLFRSRYTPDGPTSIDKVGRSWNGQRWYRHTGAPAAVPSTSNHGWGLAVDVALDADGDAAWEWPPKSLDRRALDWLLANAEKYGWSWELQSEPWHLRVVCGDNLPQAVLDHEAGNAPAPVPPAPEPTPAPQPTYTGSYVVQRGDSWWRIALRTLGTGNRWRELQDANPGVALHPGVRVAIPGAKPPQQPAAPNQPRAYKVRPGDSWWRIAVNELRNGQRWQEVANLNNNQALHPGQVIKLPPR